MTEKLATLIARRLLVSVNQYDDKDAFSGNLVQFALLNLCFW